MDHGDPADPSATQLSFAEVLRAHKNDILAEWERAVRTLSIARDLDRDALIDHLPSLLDRIAQIADELARGNQPALPREEAERHAMERLDEGFDLPQVIVEYSLLRDCLIGVWATGGQREGFRILNQAIDRAITASVERFTGARDRTLQALDRIAAASVESRELGEFLQRLLQAMQETTPAVDTAVLLLKEGDWLRARAFVGLPDEELRDFAIRLWEGFSGLVARERAPRLIRQASTDPLVRMEPIRKRGVRALFGVPVIAHGELLGVAHMGSLTAFDFSEQDKRLFLAMANRASAAILQHVLRETAEASVRRLGQSEERLRMAVEATKLGTWDHDLESGRLEWSEKCRDLFGVGPRTPVQSEVLLAAVHPEDRPHLEEAIATACRPATGGWLQVDFRTSPERDGRVRWLESRGRVSFNEQGRPIRITGTVLDITERRRFEEERELFFGALGHDLKNPLTAITMAAHLLLRRSLPTGSRGAVARIANSADRMTRLINQLLDFAMARSGAVLPIELRTTDLHEICRDVVAEAELSFPDRAIHLECDGDGVGRWDRDRLAQVIQNLLWNALHYGDPRQPVTIHVHPGNGERATVLEVHNEGTPIPEALLPVLFDPFRRGVLRKQGLGLGLYIVRQIVDAHRGTIEVSSSSKRGTTFTVRLPIHGVAGVGRSD